MQHFFPGQEHIDIRDLPLSMTALGFLLSMPISTSSLLYYLSSHTRLHESIRFAGLHHKLGFMMTQL